MNTKTNTSKKKFQDPYNTLSGDERAYVDFESLKTLWVNTGTLCNIECINCYIESGPRNDRLMYIKASELSPFLNEIEQDLLGTSEIGFTGGEPFMNRDIIPMLRDVLSRDFKALVLTNAMRPMQNRKKELLELKNRFGDKLKIRVSVDHYMPEKHEQERGKGSWGVMIEGLKFLSNEGFNVDVAGRTPWQENEEDIRSGYCELFTENKISINAFDPVALTLFPEMDENIDVPEITTACWDILGVSPKNMMCANSRMLVKRKHEKKPVLTACTLVPYDKEFEMGNTIGDSLKAVWLNHPHCAAFCVLGGGACSAS